MTILREEFVKYLQEVEKNLSPNGYATGLLNVEKYLKVDIDAEYEKDCCESLYNRLQELRKTPEIIGKNEHTVRQYAANVKKYKTFRKWKEKFDEANFVKKKENENKYSIEWFKAISEEEEYIQFKIDADLVRHSFEHKFGIERLKELKGINLLRTLFYNDLDNIGNMCYTLEMDKKVKSYFGSISGGSAYKFGLFNSNKTKLWMTGSPTNSIILTEDEAIEKGTQIRDWLVEAVETIELQNQFNSVEDYKSVYDKLKHIPYIDYVWFMKYLQMIFPTIFATTYGKTLQYKMLEFLNEKPCESSFINLGLISLATKKYEIANDMFGYIYYKEIYPVISSVTSDPSIGTGLADDNVKEVRYWIYSPGEGAKYWDDFYKKGIIALGWEEIGNYSQYNSKQDMVNAMKKYIDPSKSYMNASLATWQFYKEMKPGDIVFAKRGVNTLIGRGVVVSEYLYNPSENPNYPNMRKIHWTHNGQWEHPGRAVMKTLTDISAYTTYVTKLNSLFEEESSAEEFEEVETLYPEYTSDDFLNEVYMDEENYETLIDLIRMKKNVILQGAPGVGKTFAAKRLAYSMMGEKNQDRVMMVQFHQSYTYEDFIEGFRPSNSGNGFEIKKGSFYNFCKKAADDLDNEYFFIIDEINRGNLSKIFGELFMLIENDKRGNSLQLLYSDEKFFVPNNVYIIGMMNTADRSLAMLDYALRRRFAFFEMKPGFNTEGFREYRMALENQKFNNLIDCVEKLNNIIASDESLGDGFCVGHSYFCNIKNISEKTLSNIVEYELIPLLKEYWFDEPLKVKDWSSKLRSSIK